MAAELYRDCADVSSFNAGASAGPELRAQGPGR
jgi:hypothetical protein